jgi:hypothetical protein
MTIQGNARRAFTPALVLAAAVAMVTLSVPSEVGAGPPKPDGEACRFDRNCLNGFCAKTSSTKFGVCCATGFTPDTSCDGFDDDCDGSVDEEFVSQVTTCGVGTCAATGMTICEAGEVRSTCTPGPPASETCNRIDDDCDGGVDEGVGCMGECPAACVDAIGQFAAHDFAAHSLRAAICSYDEDQEAGNVTLVSDYLQIPSHWDELHIGANSCIAELQGTLIAFVINLTAPEQAACAEIAAPVVEAVTGQACDIPPS